MTRRGLFVADGLFLGVTGLVQLVFELVAYHTGGGPLGHIFDGSHLTIGWVEAHGQAALIGILFLTVARRDLRRFWHTFGLAEHALLGGANLYFWSSFGHYDVVPMGVLATAAHVGFVVAHAWCLATTARRDTGRRDTGRMDTGAHAHS